MTEELPALLAAKLDTLALEGEPMLRLFRFIHLRENLQPTGMAFASLAVLIVENIYRNPERSACLRKLREAKDCAIAGIQWED